jgi:hypothetical protein
MIVSGDEKLEGFILATFVMCGRGDCASWGTGTDCAVSVLTGTEMAQFVDSKLASMQAELARSMISTRFGLDKTPGALLWPLEFLRFWLASSSLVTSSVIVALGLMSRAKASILKSFISVNSISMELVYWYIALCFDFSSFSPLFWKVKGKQAGLWRGGRSGLSLTVYHTLKIHFAINIEVPRILKQKCQRLRGRSNIFPRYSG